MIESLCKYHNDKTITKKNMRNPFYFKRIPDDAPFCNRQRELEELKRHAFNSANVVIPSPRRSGKTSLVRRMQVRLKEEGEVLPLYIDFYGVTSIGEIASKIATEVYRVTRLKESLYKRAAQFLLLLRPNISVDPISAEVTVGVDVAKDKSEKELLENVMTGLGEFMSKTGTRCNIAFDEFQDITDLKESRWIEGMMRSHIQNHENASYFFIGSKRRLLLDMFNDDRRAFYQSSINYKLSPLPEKDLIEFLMERFKAGGLDCSEEVAKSISDITQRNPYYSQKLAYHIYEISKEKEVSLDDVKSGFQVLLTDETSLYEALLQALSSKQIAGLVAIAKEPTEQPFAFSFVSKYSLGSVGTMQAVIRKLLSLDYIEISDKRYKVVDPIFAEWLKRDRNIS